MKQMIWIKGEFVKPTYTSPMTLDKHHPENERTQHHRQQRFHRQMMVIGPLVALLMYSGSDAFVFADAGQPTQQVIAIRHFAPNNQNEGTSLQPNPSSSEAEMLESSVKSRASADVR